MLTEECEEMMNIIRFQARCRFLQDEQTMEYFAYGSNMNPERMKQRIGWSPPSRGAVLQDYQLMFDKQSNDGGKANIRPLKGEAVEGVLYQLAEKDLLSLDGFEGVSTGDYTREKLEVIINGDGKCLACLLYTSPSPRDS